MKKNKKLKYWGWGYEETILNKEEIKSLLNKLCKYGIVSSDKRSIPTIESINLNKPKIEIPPHLKSISTVDKYQRILHSFGQSQPDSIRTFKSDFNHAPDLVSYPRNENDLMTLYEFCEKLNVALIPYGAGSSVVGGVTSNVSSKYNGTISVNLSKFNKVLEVDDVSLSAKIQGGIRGPDLEMSLKNYGLTLRHFPQSFEHSTLGGWIATRSGGHFATLYTHIDDLVENISMISPNGKMNSLRVPGSGAGPSPDRFMLGSEGSMGIITDAWVKLQKKPKFKATAGYLFSDFLSAAQAVRSISQAGLYPANVRIVDEVELDINSASKDSYTLMVISFENADHEIEPWISRGEECCLDHGGIIDVDWRNNPLSNQHGVVGAWREAFIKMPYNREELTPRNIISDTFETSITWEKFDNFYHSVKNTTELAIKTITGKSGAVSCRFSHSYPNGPAPYFAFHANSSEKTMLEDWLQIKKAASDAVHKFGGTITHHHAIGRDHSHWYKKQRPNDFGEILSNAKKYLDPKFILNPGVIVE